MHSHFQYVLVNKTEADISYCQLKTTDVKRLPPNTDTVYSFANPYLPKILGTFAVPTSVLSLGIPIV